MGEMGAATHQGTAVEAPPNGFTAELDGAEMPAAILSSETLRWAEITYRDQTFVLNKELVIRVMQEEGGWSFAEDEFRLLGFGHTRSEAELMFCYDFSFRWNEIACEGDERLSRQAQEVKRAFLSLVGGVK
jgi:hypothetical protein